MRVTVNSLIAGLPLFDWIRSSLLTLGQGRFAAQLHFSTVGEVHFGYARRALAVCHQQGGQVPRWYLRLSVAFCRPPKPVPKGGSSDDDHRA